MIRRILKHSTSSSHIDFQSTVQLDRIILGDCKGSLEFRVGGAVCKFKFRNQDRLGQKDNIQKLGGDVVEQRAFRTEGKERARELKQGRV